jgi:hypothetical protein
VQVVVLALSWRLASLDGHRIEELLIDALDPGMLLWILQLVLLLALDWCGQPEGRGGRSKVSEGGAEGMLAAGSLG